MQQESSGKMPSFGSLKKISWWTLLSQGSEKPHPCIIVRILYFAFVLIMLFEGQGHFYLTFLFV